MFFPTPDRSTLLTSRRGQNRHASGQGAHAQRLVHLAAVWDRLLPDLLDDYLRWRYRGVPSKCPDRTDASGNHRTISLSVVTWSGIERRSFSAPNAADNDVRVLIQHGYIPCSPELPRLAIHVPVLDLQHHARLRAFVSHEAWTRILCDVHGVPYQTSFSRQVAAAYDTYVQILQGVDDKVNKALHRDAPDWRVKHSCPACTYKLQDEVPLALSRLICGDGNNSSKRFAHSGRHDPRVYHSDYLLPEGEVNQFQNEVKRRTGTQSVKDGEEYATACADKWKAAQARTSGGSFRQALDETGHFLTVCRHAFVLYSVDMIRSGELAKYPLASLDRCMDAIGPDIGFGYDIGCTHSTTVFRSCIGDKAQERRLRFFVGAFHGYAHNRRCQLSYHPRLQTVAGLEDFETCEWIFSQQNHTARLFRHASSFHRHMTMHWFYRRWDSDRRAALGDFLYKNYRQALDIIHDVQPALQNMLTAQLLSELDLERFLNEERAYLDGLEQEPDGDQTAFRYLETLEALEIEQCVLLVHTQGRRQERNYLLVLRTVQDLELLAGKYEDELQTERWTSEHPDWQHYNRLRQCREFNLALDRLELLVVQRLFEMEKMNARGTGYAMRTSIARALSTRSKAIQTALETYNRLALTMSPPRPVLTMESVLDYAFLADFSILRYSRQDIRSRPWAQPHIRELLVKWLLLKCAIEEIKRLNIEIRRVLTAIEREPQDMATLIDEVTNSGAPWLAPELEMRMRRQVKSDAKLRDRLLDIMRLPGYCGFRDVGRPLTSVRPDDPANGMQPPERGLSQAPDSNLEPFEHDLSGDGVGEGVPVIDDERTQELDDIADVFGQLLSVE
ncbi:hypothetical protein CALVIDRAFT_479161 [Calocera viscosa TUFC12733]|uniref:CxC1-like cysteine cluster associated with KDZ transposases domain-containing protein n=1 Tax=Calocera viscosa (strain TUFC12733) TaxID=1330018 RepID=A0A167NXW4_CALVF|nr:hypothetical protein CALVIDRAFT_479161 [Calocera viscosa TUFC12733]